MRPPSAGDGLPLPRLTGPITRRVVRHADLGKRIGAQDHRRAMDAPALAVLSTSEDRPTDRIAAGQAVQRICLTATKHGLAVGFLNQPCQVPELRSRLAQRLDGRTAPQAVMRIGRPLGRSTASSRRPVDDVLSAY